MSKKNPFVRTDFIDHQERRKERFAELAGKNAAISNAFVRQSSDLVNAIPFGQPILVGHHSEKRHRNVIAKSQAKMDKSVEASNKAEHYKTRTASVGKGGIASDDPDALVKLKDKLYRLEINHAKMIRMNKEFRKGGWDAVTDLSKKQIIEYKNSIRFEAYEKQQPFQPYQLTNSKGRINQVINRIKSIESLYKMDIERVVSKGFVFDVEEGRFFFEFDGKPSQEVRDLLKLNGFRWSRYNCRWQVKATKSAYRKASELLIKLNRIESLY